MTQLQTNGLGFWQSFPIKLWFLISLFIFELGSLICGVAQGPTTLIVGRAIAGLGGAGVAVGVFTVLGFAAAPEQRPQLLSYTEATYGTAAVLGPLIGGAFTDKVTWRWCFYINLPIGGLAAVVVMVFFKPPANAKPAEATYKEKFLQMDFGGAALMTGMIISFILALQYGGQTHSWKSSVVGSLLAGFVIFVVFVTWEVSQKKRAMIVARVLKKRYVSVGSIFMFFFGGAVFNDNPISSSAKMLALIIPLTVAAILQGLALIKIGIVPLFWVISGALGAAGCGLLYTMDTHTSTGKWIGYQIIVGFSSGWGFQVALSNAQVQAAPEDMSQVTAIINIDNPIGIGATRIREAFPNSQVLLVVDAYVTGLRAVFAIMIGGYGVSMIIGFFGSWKKLHGDGLKQAIGNTA
ncbi:major facilitator superfamily domain-containing protein [Aspergillus californicus]